MRAHASYSFVLGTSSPSCSHAQGFHVNPIEDPVSGRISVASIYDRLILHARAQQLLKRVYIRARELSLAIKSRSRCLIACCVSHWHTGARMASCSALFLGHILQCCGVISARRLMRALLLLALVLVMSSCVTHGVRTTPTGTSGSAADALQPGETTPSGTASRDDDYGGQTSTSHDKEEEEEMTLKERAVMGSRLPDCAHACGPCAPCKRVMVSFRCVDAAESCPIAYRCMCRGRFFRVPTL